MRRILSSGCAGLLVAALMLPATAMGGGDTRRGAAPVPAPAVSAPAKPAVAGPGIALERIIDADGNGLFDNLEARLTAAAADERIDVVVRFADELAPGLAAVKKHLGPITFGTRWQTAVQGFAASLTPAEIRRLAVVPGVATVELDLPVQAFVAEATRWTGVRQARADFGTDGDRDGNPGSYSPTDVVVAVIDTGIDAAHVDLDGGKVIGWHDVVGNRATPYDDHGHGTHVASIVAGTGEGNAGNRGVAPGAALVGIKVLNAGGGGTMSGIISGIDWLVSHRSEFNVRVANMSLGSGGCSDGTDALSRAVENAVASGITMVVAAGNAGPAGCTIGAPAAAPGAITVGALYDPGEKGWALAEFSSRGPTLDGRIKPDIATPGRFITAARAGSGNGYVAFSGTSMAAPFAAGVVALMLDADYSLTSNGVKAILYAPATVKDFGPAGQDVDYGHGILVGYNAVRAAGRRQGTFSDGLTHAFVAGNLAATGLSDFWELDVSDPTPAVALTMIMPAPCPICPGPDFDLFLYGPSGQVLASAQGIRRQETLQFQVPATGTYRVEVRSYQGRGDYLLDASWR